MNTNNISSRPETDTPPKMPLYFKVIQLMTEKASVFLTPDREPYLEVQNNDKLEVIPVYSGMFSRIITGITFRELRKTPTKEMKEKIKDHFSALAHEEGVIKEVFIRTAFHEGNIYYDLCDDQRRVVRVSQSGWEVITNPPVKFIRKNGMLSSPLPDRENGDINLLRRYINAPEEDDWFVTASAVLGAFFTKPYVIIMIQGEQGSSKSTTSRVLVKVIDPSAVPLNSAPKNERDLFITAKNSCLLCFDNLSSGLSPSIADLFSLLSTGGGVRTRRLFTDNDESIGSSANPIILNGIDDITSRGDLLSRAITRNLRTIPPTQRVTEKEFWTNFTRDYSRIMGGVFDSLATALRNLDSVTLEEKPRMADFALFACAASESLGITPQRFMDAYNENIRRTNRDSIELDPVATSLIDLLDNSNNQWEGTMTELLEELRRYLPLDLATSRFAPQTAAKLSNKIRRLDPMLRTMNIHIEQLPREENRRPYRIFKVVPEPDDNTDNLTGR